MSFDIFLQKFAKGEAAEVSREQVRAVLKTTKFRGPDDFGFYVVDFPDGVNVELSAEGLNGAAKFTGCTFHVRGMSRRLVRFIFDIAKAGDMVILPAMEGFVPILLSPGQRQELPSDLAQNEPEPVVCGSPSELEALLSGGYASWQKYRNQITKRGT